MLRPVAAALACVLLGACSSAAPLAARPQAGAVDASGLFAPKLPAGRTLAPEETTGDFDKYMVMARRDALRWQPNAVLAAAQAVGVDAKGGKRTGTSYAFTFAAGRNAVTVAITGDALSFEKAKAVPPLDTAGIVPATQALAAALETQKLMGETFVLQLAQPQGVAAPVYQVTEMKKDGLRVVINARTGEAVIK